MLTHIQSLSQSIFAETLQTRRHLHAHPELSFEERETAQYVAHRLRELGIEVQEGIAGHGLVGIIQGRSEGKVVALRADMDALPIQEQNQVEYASTRPGIMHACGHDAHTASLLGTARILQELRTEFEGKIKLIFQPAEERAPGGASLMIKEGVLQNPQVQSILGQHVMPLIPFGKIGVRGGKYMASADEIYIKIIGKGGHGAQPQMCIDPIAIAAQLIVSLQTVISRNADPRSPSLLTFGKIIGDGATNIIPNEVWIEGTFRAMDELWRENALQRIETMTNAIVQSMGAKVELEIRRGYPVLYNDEALTGRTRQNIAAYVGEENVIDLDLWMAAEDFAFYTHQIPGCFYRLGTRNESRGITHGLHTPLFDIEEEALKLSTGLMAWNAIQELRY